jgi:hypothetical protein
VVLEPTSGLLQGSGALSIQWKDYHMATEATIFSTHIRGQDAGCKTFTKPNYLRRFRHFIEYSDWDEVILVHDEWIDKMCIVIVIVASLYLIPTVVAMLFLR